MFNSTENESRLLAGSRTEKRYYDSDIFIIFLYGFDKFNNRIAFFFR